MLHRSSAHSRAVHKQLLFGHRKGVDAVAALRQLLLHCGAHTPGTRDSVLHFLLSLKDSGVGSEDCSAVAVSLLAGPAWAHPNDIKCFPPALLAVIISVWNIPASKALGVRVIARSLPCACLALLEAVLCNIAPALHFP